MINEDAVHYLPIAPQTVNPVQATKRSLLIAIILFLKFNYSSKKEGNEKEGEIAMKRKVR